MAKAKVEQKVFTFVGKYKTVSVEYFVLEENNGKFDKIPLTKRSGEGRARLADQTPVYATKTEMFDEVPGSGFSHGYASQYVLEFKDSDTALEKAQKNEILRVLKYMDATDHLNVWSLENWNKRINPQAYAEKARVKALEDDLENIKDESTKKDSKIEELQKKIDEIMKKSGSNPGNYHK